MKDKFILAGFAVILAYMLPYFILGENAYITILDFLDQNVVIIADLKNNGLLTSLHGTVPNMNGLDRSLFPYFTPFDVKMLCYLLLPTYWAVIAYTLIYKLIAFLGMYMLLDSYLFRRGKRWITLFLSLGFALVPFYMELALSGAGFPLVSYAFLNLYNKRYRGWSYGIIVFYAFNSLLAYGGFFFLAVLLCWMIYLYIRKKEISVPVLGGALLLCLVYVLANWGTLCSLFFSSSFVSHRTEWVHSTPLVTDLKEYIHTLLFSQYHAGTVFAAPILLSFLAVYLKYRKTYPFLTDLALLYVVIALGILSGMLLKHTHIQLFITIQFDRFYFFYPSIVFLLLAACCFVVCNEKTVGWTVVLVAFGLVCGIYYDGELKRNIRILTGKPVAEPSFRQFFDPGLFARIREDLGALPDYRTKVVSVGMYPSVPEYNGFYTVDSYRVNYPLSFKCGFRRVIAGELDKDATMKAYFDDWGSRCYVFSAELYAQPNPFLCGKSRQLSIQRLDIDTRVLKEMGCEFVLSAVPIGNFQELSLSFVNKYTTNQSFWEIFVYQII